MEWTFIQQALKWKLSNQPRTFPFPWYLLAEPAFPSFLRLGHLTSGITGTTRTHDTSVMVAHSYMLCMKTSCTSSLVIAFEYLYSPNNCSAGSLTIWMKRSVTPNPPREGLKRQKWTTKGWDLWSQSRAQVKFPCPHKASPSSQGTLLVNKCFGNFDIANAFQTPFFSRKIHLFAL